jgi:predicted DNA-binding transcriptional regulator AlpA
MTTEINTQMGVLTLQRIGLSRQESATFIGIGVTKFDELVSAGIMPQPRKFGSRKIWVRAELEIALISIPANDNVKPNSWDTSL